MRIYDVSISIKPGLPLWPGNPAIELERMTKLEDGAEANISRMAMGVHTGTHVDAPIHFIPGATGVDSLPLDILVGPAVVIDLPGVPQVSAGDLASANIPPGTTRLLVKTSNSAWWAANDSNFHSDYVAVTVDAAEWIVSHGVQLIGVDYLSVAPWQRSAPTHRALLQAGVVVVEGLSLAQVEPGRYSLICLPLKLVGSDGAPARAILTTG